MLNEGNSGAANFRHRTIEGKGGRGGTQVAGTVYSLDTSPPQKSHSLWPIGIAVGRFSGSAYNDIAVLTQFDAQIHFLVNKADGSGGLTLSSSSIALASSGLPVAVAAGNFQAPDQQYPDLVVTQFGAPSIVTVYLNQANASTPMPGTFQAVALPYTGFYPSSVAAVADTATGMDDVAVTNGYDGTVSVFTSNGSGVFTPPSTPIAAGNEATGVAAGLFTSATPGSTAPFLAVVDRFSDTVSTLFSGGSGSAVLSTGRYPLAAAAGDFTGARATPSGSNEPVSLAVANAEDATVTVWASVPDSNGLFSGFSLLQDPVHAQPKVGTKYPAAYPAAVAAGYLDGDQRADLATANATDGTVTVYTSNTLGGLTLDSDTANPAHSMPSNGTTNGHLAFKVAAKTPTVVTVSTKSGGTTPDPATSLSGPPGLTSAGPNGSLLVTVPAGQTSASFTVTSIAVPDGYAQTTVSATLPGGTAATDGVTVQAAPIQLVQSPYNVASSSATPTSVSLSGAGPAAVPIPIQLTTTDPAISFTPAGSGGHPSTVTIAKNGTSAPFTLNAGAVPANYPAATFTAANGAQKATGAVNIAPAAVQFAQAPLPYNVASSSATNTTVQLTNGARAAVDIPVTVKTTDPAITFSVQGGAQNVQSIVVTIPANASASNAFTINAGAVGANYSATITAANGTATSNATVNIGPAAVQFAQATYNVASGSSTATTVQLTGGVLASVAISVKVSTTDPAITFSIQGGAQNAQTATATIMAGSNSAPVTINAGSVGGAYPGATITVTNGTAPPSNSTVDIGRAAIQFAQATYNVNSVTSTNTTVQLAGGAKAAVPIQVSVASPDPAVNFSVSGGATNATPIMVTIAAGQNASNAFSINANAVGAAYPAVMISAADGSAAPVTAAVNVAALTAGQLVFNPTSYTPLSCSTNASGTIGLPAGFTAVQAFPVTLKVTDPALSLAASMGGAAASSLTVTIAKNTGSAPFFIDTLAVDKNYPVAAITSSLNAAAGPTANVSVQPVGVAQLAVNGFTATSPITNGNTANGTITLLTNAAENITNITVGSSDSTIAKITVPSPAIAAGSKTCTFTITTFTGKTGTVTLTLMMPDGTTTTTMVTVQ